MDFVERHYIRDGYDVDDVHCTPGELDFRCIRGGVEIRVEVKGTTSDGATIELTAAEHRRACARAPVVHLAVVSNIRVDRAASDSLTNTSDSAVDSPVTARRPRRQRVRRPSDDHGRRRADGAHGTIQGVLSSVRRVHRRPRRTP